MNASAPAPAAAATSGTPTPGTGPPKLDDEHLGVNGRLAAWITRRVGSMWVVYFTVAFVLTWVILATYGPLHRADPYPFPFLLFMGNVVQLLLVFVILVGQGVLGRVADRRAEQTYDDAEAIFAQVTLLHTHMLEQDRILNQGVELVESRPHPWVKQRQLMKPPRVAAQFVGVNGQIGAWITARVSTMWAFYGASLFQFGWIGLAEIGVIRFDAYPFAFLLFISSLLQLVFMFVIMVGQDVLGRAGDQRAQQTFLDAEAVLHECDRLQQHLTVQDGVIVTLCDYIKANAPATHPIRQALPPRPLPTA